VRTDTRVGSNDGERVVPEIATRMWSLLEQYYPHPIPFITVKTPFDQDIVFVNFAEPVSVPVLVFPVAYELNIDIGQEWNTFVEAKVEAEYNKVTDVVLYSKEEYVPLHDPGGAVGLTHLVSPLFANTVKKARVTSKGAGAKWLAELINATEEVRSMEEARTLNPSDLLNTSRRTEKLVLTIGEQVGDVLFSKLQLLAIPIQRGGRMRETLKADVNVAGGRKYVAIFRLDGGEVIDIEVEKGGQRGLEVIEKLLETILRSDLLRDVEVVVREFLENYKYSRIALSLLEAVS